MVRNNKLIETLYTCVKNQGSCKGCFYGDGYDQPNCTFHLMNDILFFFGNPVPDPNAHVIPLEELQEILADKKDHIAFSEFISTIHVAKPVIRTVKAQGNFITLYDPQTEETDTFNISDYYTHFRVWSSKPSDSLRNSTPWVPIDGYQYTDNSPINRTKTSDLLRYVKKASQNSTT